MSASWCWAGARAIGTAHLAGGLPCQDAFAARIARAPCGSEIMVAALADGAGSAERADAGARLATSITVEVAAEALADGAGNVHEAAPLLRYAAEQHPHDSGPPSRPHNEQVRTMVLSGGGDLIVRCPVAKLPLPRDPVE